LGVVGVGLGVGVDAGGLVGVVDGTGEPISVAGSRCDRTTGDCTTCLTTAGCFFVRW
jgi:hypothetical protein